LPYGSCTGNQNERTYRPSRFGAGIALHLAIPAYFLWLQGALLPPLTGSSRDEVATAIGRTSLQFPIIYIVAVVAMTLATRALEPTLRQARERHEARDPRTGAQQSKQSVGAALRAATSLGNGRPLLLANQQLEAAPCRTTPTRPRSPRSKRSYFLCAKLAAIASPISALKAVGSTSSPSRMSIARRVPPPKPALKSFFGSSSAAPRAKVSFTFSR